MPKKTEIVAEVESEDAEARKQRKLAKKAAKQAAIAEQEEAPAEVDEAEAKKQRKAAKKAAKMAAAAEQEEAPAEENEAEAKKQRKAAKKAAATEQEEAPAEVDEAEAKRQRKAAKKAAKVAAAATAEVAEEADEAEANKKRKAERKAAKEAAAKVAQEPEEAEDEDAPKAKKAKTEAAIDNSIDEDGDFTVFVRGLPFSCQEDVLRKDFEECGEILNLNMPMGEDGRCRGIAFVKYSNKAAMEAAIKFDGEPYGGRYLEVKRATPKEDKGKGKGDKGKGKSDKGKGKGDNRVANSDFALFVGGLPYTVTEEQVRSHFADCGEIESVRMPTFEDGSPKGIAFIRFTKDEDVQAGLNLNESDLEGRSITVRKAGDNPRKGDGKGKDGKGGKDKGKDGKGGKDKGKDGKGKKGKGKKGGLSAEQRAAKDGAIVAPAGTVKQFDDSDDE
jgi:RNA recognition motif-containing protein